MWLMPDVLTSSNVASARAWLIPPSAAAPKMTRVLSCPVRPNGRRSIMRRTVPLADHWSDHGVSPSASRRRPPTRVLPKSGWQTAPMSDTDTSDVAGRPLSTPGVWYFTDGMDLAGAAAFAERVEFLGYSTLWLPETTGRDPFAHIAFLATQTPSLRFATGIANVFHRHPGMMMQVTNTLAEQTGGRL